MVGRSRWEGRRGNQRSERERVDLLLHQPCIQFHRFLLWSSHLGVFLEAAHSLPYYLHYHQGHYLSFQMTHNFLVEGKHLFLFIFKTMVKVQVSELTMNCEANKKALGRYKL
uniref:Uncharacterized protein n=1 Tax=Cacopsylla melanoneura TaxID=428564 RepID=A0A8D9B2H7_9HEMI